MNNLKLILKEKKELEKRGFLVKNYINTWKLLLNIPFQIIFLSIFSGIGFIIGMILIIYGYDSYNIVLSSMYFVTIPVYLYFFKKTILSWILFGKVFYSSEDSVFFAYGYNLKWKDNNILSRILSNIYGDSKRMSGMIKDTPIKELFGLFFNIALISFAIFGNSQLEHLIGGNLILNYILPQLIIFFSLYLIGYFGRSIINSFHPLYAFGNLGEKIQKLTPEIEKLSQTIRKNFEKDMNFSALSSGFDSLSTTFSKIVSLVIRLERVEEKANKGNLFDSEKYINSLRSDIVEPLKSLRSFLEGQRDKLMNSQRELTRVRVGADPSLRSGGQEQSELTSKRSEKLIVELAENIEKLDAMIGKMG